MALNIFQRSQYSQRSFSQCGEDLILKFYFECKGKNRITYLDIGANHPFHRNNTALFYLGGSTGVSVEPDPELWKTLASKRSKDVNLNIAIDAVEKDVDFYIFLENTMNTISKTEADKNINERGFHLKSVQKIKTKTLASIIDEHFGGRYPDLLSIDAEGVDEFIVQSLDPSKELPMVICIETISYTPDLTGEKNAAIFNGLAEKGYKVFADTYINTIFVRK